MGVDVVDLVRRDFSALQGSDHTTLGTLAALGRSSDVIGIARKTVADDFRIDFRAARQCMFQLFENHNASAFTHHETVTVFVIRTGSCGRVVVTLGGQCLAGSKACQRNAADRRFRSTGNHDIRIAESDQTGSVADSVRASRASRHDRVVWTAKPVLDGNVAGSQIDQAARNKERRNTAWARPL